MSSIPVEEWFIFRADVATEYLKKILREVRWKATDDPYLEQFGLAQMGGLVRVMASDNKWTDVGSHSCDCGCRNYFPRCKRRNRPPFRCMFRFEMDRGRSDLGHEYALEVLSTGVTFCRMDKWEFRSVRWETLDDVTADSLLDAIREVIIVDVMGA